MTKYGAKKTEIDGITFDSRMEARRYSELKLLEHGGAIRDLVLQPAFTLTVNGTKLGTYVADFAYTDNETGETVTEDVKGYKTPMYRWKKRHVKAQYGIEIQEVQA